ncbi:MAG: 1-deoxy-D-xylulose-5-phosphate reductoisomerase, partial [Clostridiales Family XIII bacterium]|nr:1-deoxy-D-xylulose-5-phosphate reductoisomerase [Clostridiales Family XIII bacterium]
MTDRKRVAIFGSTGSIGVQALEIIGAHPERFSAEFLSCRERIDLLLEQIEIFSPSAVCVANPNDVRRISEKFPQLKIYVGEEGLCDAARAVDAEIMLNALVGIAGLVPTLSALKSGRSADSFRIALANKETLVAGGRLVMRLSAETGIAIVPVDSEHSAIFQALSGNRSEDVREVVLTGSGGPFRTYTEDALNAVTKEQALTHPTWQMGSK